MAPIADVKRGGQAENPARTLAKPRNETSGATSECNARIQARTTLRSSCGCVIANRAGEAAALTLCAANCGSAADGHAKCASARAKECGAWMVASVMSRPDASG